MTPNTDNSTASATRASSYRLPRDVTEGTRLNAQHYALIQRQGWLLHPKIEEAISAMDTPQILDAACGTAVWALEVAERFPKTFVTGLDISTDQFPPKWTWPSNSTLNTLDLLEDVPPEYLGKFDILHCRLLLAAGPMVDSEVFRSAFAKLLKPGGWLQWEEITYPMLNLVLPKSSSNGLSTCEYDLIPCRWDIFAEAVDIPYKIGWFGSFRKVMKQNSTFTDIEQLDVPVNLRTLKIENDVSIAAMLSGADRVLQSSEIDDTVKEGIRKEMAQVQAYKTEDKLVSMNFIVGLARAARSPFSN